VLHYAGSVTYVVAGFLQKNKDELSQDLVVMLQSCNNDHVKELFSTPDQKKAAAAGGTAAAEDEAKPKPGGVKAMGNRFKKMDGGGGGGGGGCGALKKAAKATQGSLFKRQVRDDTQAPTCFQRIKQIVANCTTAVAFTPHVTCFFFVVTNRSRTHNPSDPTLSASALCLFMFLFLPHHHRHPHRHHRHHHNHHHYHHHHHHHHHRQ
jgi:hypothetical protein